MGNYTPNDCDDELHSGLLHSLSWEGMDQPLCEPPSDAISSNNEPIFLNGPLPMKQIGPRQGLPRRRSRYSIQRSGGRTNPVFIPINASPLDPLERWRESPPDDEPAPMTAIIDAVRNSNTYHPETMDQNTLEHGPGTSDPEITDLFRTYRRPRSCAASTTSAESAASVSSRQSGNSGASNESRDLLGKKPNGQSQARVRKTQSGGRNKKQTKTDNNRPFSCTFCCDRFKSKYDWVRHEKSLHLNLENWLCAPFGGAVLLPSTNRMHCAYCNMLDPTAEHLGQHHHQECESQSRVFRRKDHLVQHLRRFHRLDTLPLIDDWKSAATGFISRCGFCGDQMTSWDERANHLAAHFRSGLTMASWKGDHGFPPSIAAKVTHSVPPYLIHVESQTLVPFSATNGEVRDHLSQMLTRSTFNSQSNSDPDQEQPDMTSLLHEPKMENPPLDSYTQLLTLHLSHFAQQQMHHGIIPTDKMFQQEARRLLFDSEDPWNQTIADHPQWLAAFRTQQHGDGFI